MQEEDDEDDFVPVPKAKPILEFQFEFEKSAQKGKTDKVRWTQAAFRLFG